MPEKQRLRLERDGVARLVDHLALGAFATRVRSLRGGGRRRVFEVRWRERGGRTGRVVVRLAPDRGGAETNAVSEFKTLTALHAAGYPVPRPILVDIEEYFSRPAIVMQFAGRPVAQPRNRDKWLRCCAEALASMHAISPATTDLSHLAPSSLDERRASQEMSLSVDHLSRFEQDGLIKRVVDAMQQETLRQEPVTMGLVHEDYWPGNILWRRGRISAVIDWTEAALGDPARDVAQFQIDLSLMYDLEAAVTFGELYSVAAGVTPANLRYVQLYGIRPALAHLEDWYLPGYVDLGLDLTLPVLEERFRNYIGWVLDHRAV